MPFFRSYMAVICSISLCFEARAESLETIYHNFEKKYNMFVEICQSYANKDCLPTKEKLREVKEELQEIGEQYIDQLKEKSLKEENDMRGKVVLSEGGKSCVDMKEVIAGRIISIMEELDSPRVSFLKRLGVNPEKAKRLIDLLNERGVGKSSTKTK